MTAPGPPPQPNDRLEHEIKSLWSTVRELARKTLYRAVISAGGLLIRDGGEFEVQTENGTPMFFLGKLNAGGTDYRGIRLKRENGTDMFYNGLVASDANKVYFAWLDRDGNVIVSDDAVTGEGLARPWLSMPTVPVLASMIPRTTSATYASVYSTGWVIKQQPSCDVHALLYSTGGATGNARYTCNGVQVGNVEPIAAGMFGWTAIQVFDFPGSYNDYVRVELQVQRTNAVGDLGGVLVATQRQF